MKKWGVDNKSYIFKTNKQNKHGLWIFAWGVATTEPYIAHDQNEIRDGHVALFGNAHNESKLLVNFLKD